MSRNSVYWVALLTAMWVVLREDFSVWSAAQGVVIGVFCVFFCGKFLPLPKTSAVNPLRLAVYLLFLLKEIYKAGFWVIKIILKGSRLEIMDMKTSVKNSFSRVALANSITIVPGSLSLNVKDDIITALWLIEKDKNHASAEIAAKQTVQQMEKILSKVQE